MSCLLGSFLLSFTAVNLFYASCTCIMAEGSSELRCGALIDKCSKLLSMLSDSLFPSLVLIRLTALAPLSGQLLLTGMLLSG